MDMDCLTLEIRILANHLYRKIMSGIDGKLSMHQGLILGYVISHNDRQITQREIENLFEIRRSTANHMFQLMERNGYISRETSSVDARMKIICVTEAGLSAHSKFLSRFQDFEAQLRQGFSEHEIETFRSMMHKIWDNANLDM